MSKDSDQPSLFGAEDMAKTWEKEWVGMPEYKNSKFIEPELTATFKFRCQEDFDEFMEVVKDKLYKGQRVFDGKQLKNHKTTWYPLEERPSSHVYVVPDEE